MLCSIQYLFNKMSSGNSSHQSRSTNHVIRRTFAFWWRIYLQLFSSAAPPLSTTASETSSSFTLQHMFDVLTAPVPLICVAHGIYKSSILPVCSSPIGSLSFSGPQCRQSYGKSSSSFCHQQNLFHCVTRAPLLYFIRSWVALSFKVRQ